MDKDDWGLDPNVRAMRRVFSGMESALGAILHELAISPYDQRIRGWLDTALQKYESAWHLGRQMGVSMDEDKAPVVYTHCLVRVIAAAGINIRDSMLPAERKIAQLVSEVFA